MNLFTSSSKSDVKAILMTLLIIGLADSALRLSELKLSIDVRHIRSFPVLARELSAAPAPRIVFLGNSLTRYGVDEAAWTSAMAELNSPAGSVAKLVPDDTTMADWYYVALNNLIRPGYRPEVMVLGFSLNQLSDERIQASRLGAYFCDLGNVGELFTKDLKGFASKVDFLVGRLCRLYGVRDEIQARVGDKLIPGYQEGVRQLNEMKQRKSAKKNRSPAGKGNSYALLERALALWRAQGIEVVLVAMPIPSGYEIDPALILKAQSAGVRLIDARELPTLTREDFPDGYHLGSRGAKVYTKFLAERLAGMFRKRSLQAGVTAQVD